MTTERPTWAIVADEVETLRLDIQSLEHDAVKDRQHAEKVGEAARRSSDRLYQARERLVKSEAILEALCKRDGIEDRHLQAHHTDYVMRNGKAVA